MASKHPMLDGNVDVKNYGQINVPMTEQEKNTPIPEPTFTPPPFEMDDDEGEQQTSEQPKEKVKKEPFNEDLEDLTTSEKRKQAESMADMALGVYGYVHQLPEVFAKINESMANEAHLKGEINLYAVITFPDGRKSTIESIIQEYNSEITGAFQLSETFKENVRPYLIRILLKKGIGLTDEEMIAYYVVMDLVETAPKFFQLMKNKNKTFDELKEISKNLRTTGATNVTAPTNTETPPTTENSAPSPLAENETVNVKKDGTVETVQIEEEEAPARRGRKPKEK